MAELTIVVQPQTALKITRTPQVAEIIRISGRQGPAGRDGGSFNFTQASASDTWTISHNLGFYPNVTVVDSLGREIEGDIQYIDSNNIQISFTAAFAGNAYLS